MSDTLALLIQFSGVMRRVKIYNYAICDFNNHDLTHRYISESCMSGKVII